MNPQSDQSAFPVNLGRSRIANGGWEWYFTLDGERIYANEHRVGIFTDPDVTPEEAFRRLLASWLREPAFDEEQRKPACPTCGKTAGYHDKGEWFCLEHNRRLV